jgi:hypothetical protein
MKIVEVNFEEVKVGDTVYLYNTVANKWGDLPRTVIAKHQAPGDDRQFVVAAFKGDIPEARSIQHVGKEYIPNIEKWELGKTIRSDRGTSEFKLIHFTTVDGVLDLCSVRMMA